MGTLGEYKGLKMPAQVTEVEEEAVTAEIERLLAQNAELVLKEEGTLENGDTAIFDFEGSVDGVVFEGGTAENYELKIGSGQFIPGFEEQMVGMALGEEKDLKVKDAIFKVKLHEMKVTELPELTDEFVKDLDREGIETVDALKEDTKATLQKRLDDQNQNAKVDFVVDEAAKNASYDLPKEMVINEKDRLVDNITQQAKQYNLELEQYLQFSGVTKEDFEKY